MVEKTALSRMLDEIERLRTVVAGAHGQRCSILRTDECSCGANTAAASTLVECVSLRAMVAQRDRVITMQQVEIARLDRRVFELKCQVKHIDLSTLRAAA